MTGGGDEPSELVIAAFAFGIAFVAAVVWTVVRGTGDAWYEAIPRILFTTVAGGLVLGIAGVLVLRGGLS